MELHSFDWAEKHGFQQVYFKSESAELYEKNGRYTVFYDETKPPAHSKFSILHEFFHYESNHDLNAGEKNTELYNKQELEANFFAAEIRFKTLKSYPNFLRSNEEKEFDEYLVKFIFKKFSEFACKFKIIRASHFFLDSPSLIYNFYCFNLKKMLQKNKMLLLEK